MGTINFVLQGKGGVGKSFIASLLAQFYQRNEQPLICVDTDPVNRTFSGYSSFSVERIELLKNNQIDSAAFDQIMELLFKNEQCNFVIDNGASSFLPLTAYLIETQALNMMQEAGYHIRVHTIITGGQALRDTINGFLALCQQFPDSGELVVWLNHFFGTIEKDGKPFKLLKAYQDHEHRVSALLEIPEQSDLFKQDIKKMLEARQTFQEAIQSGDTYLMSKQRLKMSERELFALPRLAAIE